MFKTLMRFIMFVCCSVWIIYLYRQISQKSIKTKMTDIHRDKRNWIEILLFKQMLKKMILREYFKKMDPWQGAYSKGLFKTWKNTDFRYTKTFLCKKVQYKTFLFNFFSQKTIEIKFLALNSLLEGCQRFERNCKIFGVFFESFNNDFPLD